jgi:hypothetical protein
MIAKNIENMKGEVEKGVKNGFPAARSGIYNARMSSRTCLAPTSTRLPRRTSLSAVVVAAAVRFSSGIAARI